jgi:phage tail sheath gpL-like
MASPNISFDSIPSSIRKPGKYFEYNAKLAVRSLPTNLQRVLIVAQKRTAGTATANQVVQVFDSETAATLFGRGSQAHRLVKAALKANRYAQLFVLPVDDSGTGVAATATLTVTGNATGNGAISINVAGTDLVVPVTTGDAAATVAASVLAELNKLVDLPTSQAVVGGVVTLTQLNKGVVGNAHRLAASSSATGIAIAATAFTGGLNDPALATPLAAAFTGGHEILVVPYTTGTPLTDLRTHLNSVSSPMERRPAIGVYASAGSLSAATTQAGTLNSERMTAAFLKNGISTAEETAAAYAAVIAFEEDPARPLNTLVLTGITVPMIADRLSRTEQETCLANGVTPLEWGPGDVVQIVRAVTTYTLNPASVADVSWLNLTTIRTMDYVMKAMRTRVELRFPRDKLSAKTPDRVRSELLDVAYKLEELEIIENVDLWKNDLVCERDSQDTDRLNAKIPVDVVNSLHVFAGRLDLIL